MSEEMNKEAEVQEDAVDIPVTDGSEEEAADTAQTAEACPGCARVYESLGNLTCGLPHTYG